MTPRKPARLRCNMYFEFQHFPSRIWHLNYRRIQYSLRISAGDGDSGMCHAPHVAARAHIPLFRVGGAGEAGRRLWLSGNPVSSSLSIPNPRESEAGTLNPREFGIPNKSGKLNKTK